MQELKARSFRITDETSEKIKELAKEIDGNQQEVIAKMIEAYEFQKGKTILTSKKGELEKFEQYTSLLTHMFMNILEENQHITESVYSEFESQFKSRDLTIQTLQEETRSLKQKKLSAIEELEVMKKENKKLQQQLEKIQKDVEEKRISYETIFKDKEELNQVLVSSVNDLKNQLKEMNNKFIITKEEIKHYKELKIQFQKLEQNKNDLENELQELKNQNKKTMLHLEEDNKNKLENLLQKVELEQEKRLLEYKKTHQEEIDKYQKKYLELLEKLQKKEQQTAIKRKQTQPKQTKEKIIENNKQISTEK